MAEMTHVEQLDVTIPEASLKEAALALLGMPSHPVSQYALVMAMIEYLEERSFWTFLDAAGDMGITGIKAVDLDFSDYKEVLAIFRKLAPHLRDGGQIEFFNEDIGNFRWKFEGGQLHQQIRSGEWLTAV